MPIYKNYKNKEDFSTLLDLVFLLPVENSIYVVENSTKFCTILSMQDYNHNKIEKKWQKFWLENKTFQAKNNSSKPKFYALDMFPYPSGAGLHVGHPLGMTATDIISRKKRHEGFNVLHPMGWDAFGLPAENYAIKTGVHPQVSTQENIANFRRQIQSLGFSYDWNREIDTTDPNYYKWSQWIFLQLYKKGLAYESDKAMNWCPQCKIVAANEEVEQGMHERCGSAVEKKKLKQWMFRITDYAERLLNDLESPTVHIFHGWGADSKSNWFANSREFLENHQVDCQVLDFPNTETPKYEEWETHFEKNVKNISPQDIFIGHSLGCVFALHYIQEKNLKLDQLILVAPPQKIAGLNSFPKQKVTWDDILKNAANIVGVKKLKEFVEEANFDWAKIRENINEIEIYYSDDDPYIPLKHFEELAENLQAKKIFLPKREHLMDADFPELREKLDSIQRSVLDWPDKIKAMQRNWIGKSKGAEVEFEVENFAEKITVYTTRPDTLFGATYFVLSPEHPLVDKITTPESREKIENYKKECANKSELERTELNKDKSGVFTGSYVINPVNGKKLPIWIADYVMMSYGTGAIMAVPAHDDRDFEFATKYGIKIIPVIKPLIAKYTIIEKSLKNAEQELQKFGKIKVIQTDPDWGKFFEVSVSHDKEEKFRGFLKKNLLSEEISGAKSFYADSIGTSNFVVYNGKEFHIYDKNSAKKCQEYGLSIGIPSEQVDFANEEELSRFCFSGDGILENSEFLNDLLVEESKKKMTKFLEEKKIGKKKINYKLRDWIFTRQRYWGEPIPLVFDENGKCYPLADSELPLKLPETPNYAPSADGQSPLAKITDWVNVRGDIQTDGTVVISENGKTKFSRETSTMPNWAGSSWYWLRYMDPQNPANFCDKEIGKYWGPVDLYVGGAEHAVLHLLYSRFWHKVLYDLDLVSTKEPFKKLVNQGLIMGEDGNKMSKSLGNVINPDEIVEKYGADTFRIYEMFMGPFEQSKPWASGAVGGIRRFLDRIWRVSQKEIVEAKTPDGICPTHGPELHKTIKIVGEHIEEFKFNTALSQMMVMINILTPLPKIPREMLKRFTIILSPFAPHMAEEIWCEVLGEKTSISDEPWPKYDEKALIQDEVIYAVQVNGKVRGELKITKNTAKDDVITSAKSIEKVAKYLSAGEIKKEIFVPGKIIGFVVK